MLTHMRIENIALINGLEIDFGPGFVVLTGETGAGKSIIIDSVSLALGERADRELISAGAAKAVVEAEFEFPADGPAQAFLDAEGLSEEGDEGRAFVSRELYAAGRNICRINGRLVQLSVLRQFTSYIVDLHGQHEHQSLLDENNHIKFLDSMIKDTSFAEELSAAYDEYRSIKREIEAGFGSEQERAQRLDMLDYQIKEIKAAGLQPGEEDDIRARLGFMQGAEKIASAVGRAHDALYGVRNGGAIEAVGLAMRELGRITDIGEEFEQLHSRITDAYYDLEDIAGEIGDINSRLEFDPKELDDAEERLDEIRRLERKYGADEAAVLEFYKKAVEEKDRLENIADTIALLEKKRDAAGAALSAAAAKLTSEREKAAAELKKAIEAELAGLGMKSARFDVSVTSTADPDKIERSGGDKVVFLLSPNRGQPMKPLARIASGGETSRLMLGFKSAAAAADAIPCLIFDEIDTGISGQMAQVVGEKMAALSRTHQVICVTHLPQIAALADEHYLVNKYVEDGNTYTSITKLDGDKRAMEVARIYAGDNISAAALEHARQMIAAGKKIKSGGAV